MTGEQQERLSALIHVAGDLALELQLAAEHASDQGHEALSRFYREAALIISDLAAVGHPAVVHYLVRTLQICVPVDARGVFLLVGRVVRGGAKGGYQYETMGRDAIVQLVERYLAEYREILQDDPECLTTLRELLEIFVRVGWPSARRLVYRLDEIFR